MIFRLFSVALATATAVVAAPVKAPTAPPSSPPTVCSKTLDHCTTLPVQLETFFYVIDDATVDFEVTLDYCNLEGGSCGSEDIYFETTVNDSKATIRYIHEKGAHPGGPLLFVFWPKDCSITLEMACNHANKRIGVPEDLDCHYNK